MITHACVATYELNPAFAETYALEQGDRVVGIVLNPVASVDQIASWQARVAEAIDEEVEGSEAVEGVIEGLVDGVLAVTLRIDTMRAECALGCAENA
jgi:hypothetical protein